MFSEPSSQIKQLLRVSVGLAAIHYRPPAQSLASYITDLRTRFPCGDGSENFEWRERAIVYEEQVDDLKRQLDEQQIELLTLRAAKRKLADSSNNSIGKKKQKTDAPSRTLDFATLVGGLAGHPFSGLKTTLDLFTSFRLLSELSISEHTQDGFLQASKRTLGSLGKLLDLGLTGTDLVLSRRTIKATCTLLPVFFTTAASFPAPNLDDQMLFSYFYTTILKPTIRSFIPLCQRESEIVFRRTRKGSKERDSLSQYDPRPDTLNVILITMRCLGMLKTDKVIWPRQSRELITLETCREIEKLWPARSSRAIDREKRKWAITRKDSLWYLCAVLDLVTLEPVDDSLKNKLVSSATIKTLATVISRIDAVRGGEIEKQMVSGMLEKAWMLGVIT